MKQSIKIVFTFLFVATFTSCLTHFYTKDEIIKLDKKRVKKKIEGSIMIDDKNNVVLTMLRDSNYQEMESIFYFNTKGKQIKHTLINSCDSCFKKMYQQ
jgi:hypothetical protein